MQITKRCHMFGSGSDVKVHVLNLEGSPYYTGPKIAYFRVFLQHRDFGLSANIFTKKRDRD